MGGGRVKVEKQLDEWVKGNPIHNNERDECCPDFACCNNVKTDKATRERFAKAYYEGDYKTMDEMLMMFLGNSFASEKIYIAGSEAIEHGEQ